MPIFDPIWRVPKGHRMPDQVMMLGFGMFVGLGMGQVIAAGLREAAAKAASGDAQGTIMASGQTMLVQGVFWGVTVTICIVGCFREAARRRRVRESLKS